MCVDLTQNVLNTFFKAMMETGSNMLRPQRWKLVVLLTITVDFYIQFKTSG